MSRLPDTTGAKLSKAQADCPITGAAHIGTDGDGEGLGTCRVPAVLTDAGTLTKTL